MPTRALFSLMFFLVGTLFGALLGDTIYACSRKKRKNCPHKNSFSDEIEEDIDIKVRMDLDVEVKENNGEIEIDIAMHEKGDVNIIEVTHPHHYR